MDITEKILLEKIEEQYKRIDEIIGTHGNEEEIKEQREKLSAYYNSYTPLLILKAKLEGYRMNEFDLRNFDYNLLWDGNITQDEREIIIEKLGKYLEEISENPFKREQKVKLKEDGKIYTIYAVYSKNEVSLGWFDYPDTEQDEQTIIDKIEAID